MNKLNLIEIGSLDQSTHGVTEGIPDSSGVGYQPL